MAKNGTIEWEEVTLTDVCGFKGGTQPPKSTFVYQPKKGYVRLLQIRDFTSDKHATFIKDEPGLRKCAESDVLLGRYGASVGKVLRGKAGAYNVAICRVVPDESRLSKDFLFCYLQTQAFQSEIVNLGDGRAVQAGFNKTDLAGFKIPVPPLAEQRRIVARVEALTRRLDQARQARQAALAEAETLLSSAVSKAQKKFKRAGKSTVLGEILTDLQYGTSVKASVHPVGTPVIRMGNIQNGRILTDKLKYLQLPPAEFKRYRLDEGDVLINRTNSAELVGKTGLFDLAGDYVFASYLIRLRVNRSIADPAFVNYAINSDDGLAYLRSQGKDAIGQTNINTKQIRQMPITVPSLPAQRELVARLDGLRGKLDALQRLQREVELELASFTPALLAKAFRGEL